MAQYDLTSKIGQHLDRHLVAPLLEFLAAQNVRVTVTIFCKFSVKIKLYREYLKFMGLCIQIYNSDDVLQSKLGLLTETKMVDYAIDVFKKLHADQEIPQVTNFSLINASFMHS